MWQRGVLGYFGKAAAQLMAMGFAIQFKNGQTCSCASIPTHLNGGNITSHAELDPTEVTDLNGERWRTGYLGWWAWGIESAL